VRVRGRNAARPSNRAHRRALNRQVQRDLGIAADLPGTTVPTGQIVAGPAGPRGVEHLAFVPGQATVAVGSTLTFTMDPDTREVHTATVGPGNIEDPASYLGSIAASFQAPVTDPRAVYPSSPPPEIVGISPTAHGNGYANTGLIDNNPDTPAPTAATVRFDAAGTYSFYCLIHPFMLATVVAQE
jgi:plastocyanin